MMRCSRLVNVETIVVVCLAVFHFGKSNYCFGFSTALTTNSISVGIGGVASTSPLFTSKNTADEARPHEPNVSSESSMPASPGSESDPSPWKSSKWRFTLNIGREPDTYMPEEWGASGGRLVLSVDVQVDSDRISKKVDTQRESVDDPLLKHNPFSMKLLSTKSTYITNKGEQICEFGEIGGWKIRFPLIEQAQERANSYGRGGSNQKVTGRASTLRCYIDLLSTIERNDIKLNGKERIYLTSKCWREDDVEYAYERLKPIQQSYENAQERLDNALSHEYGDRRLDGNDIIDTIAGMKDTAQLVIERDQALRNYEEAKVIYPTIPLSKLPEGPWPGQVEWLSLEPKMLLVRREKFLVGDEYHIIGTWTATPLLEDDDGYELEDDTLSMF